MITNFQKWPVSVKAFARTYASTAPDDRRDTPDQFILQNMGITGTGRLVAHLKALHSAGLIDLEKNYMAGADAALLACAAHFQAEANGLPIAAYQHKKTTTFDKTGLMNHAGEKGYYIGKLKGQPCYSNGYVVVLGTPPDFTPTKDVEYFDAVAKLDVDRVEVKPVAYAVNEGWALAPRRIYFNTGMAVNAAFYDLFVTRYQHPTFKAEDNPNSHFCLLVYGDGGELVGLIMPLRPTAGNEDGAMPAGVQALIDPRPIITEEKAA